MYGYRIHRKAAETYCLISKVGGGYRANIAVAQPFTKQLQYRLTYSTVTFERVPLPLC